MIWPTRPRPMEAMVTPACSQTIPRDRPPTLSLPPPVTHMASQATSSTPRWGQHLAKCFWFYCFILLLIVVVSDLQVKSIFSSLVPDLWIFNHILNFVKWFRGRPLLLLAVSSVGETIEPIRHFVGKTKVYLHVALVVWPIWSYVVLLCDSCCE